MASIQRIAPSLVGMLLAGAVQAEVPAIFQGADLKLGAKLIAEHKCNQCHAQKWGRDGVDIYRPKGRIHDAGKLRGMVDYCSNQLGLTLFPEEVTAIAAALNRDHYHFQR
ncbi:hypothetical protein [Ottowia sp.]|uniref:hypothetical protein n=1 Tax=Ottowia sp. TaxID=1898956 RepID=UPI00262DD8C3|nr:hypothetical protein [Ottowia sp.]